MSSVGSVSTTSSILASLLGETESSAPAKALTPAQKMEQERLEVQQIEFLARRLGELDEALQTVRDEWRSASRMSTSRARKLAGAVRDAFAIVNEIFTYDVPGGGEPAKFLQSARNSLLKALENGAKYDTGGVARDLRLDLDFDLDDDEEITGAVLPDGGRLEKMLFRTIRKNTYDAQQLLFGKNLDEGAGLLVQLEIQRGALWESLTKTAGFRGVSLDAYA